MIADSNAIIRAFLADPALCPELDSVVDGRIYCPRLPEGAELPALAFLTRGGTSTPYIANLPSPSIQCDCWGTSPQEAREVYRALYSDIQGIQNIAVTIGLDTYYIKGVEEEVQGQDIQPVDPQGYHRVITFFKVILEV